MPEHLSASEIADLQAHRVDAAQLLALSQHLAHCHTCRAPFEASGRLRPEILSLRDQFEGGEEFEHLAYEQIAAYVDNSVNETDLELVESHLEFCEQCHAEAQELRAFAASMDSGTTEVAPQPFAPALAPQPQASGKALFAVPSTPSGFSIPWLGIGVASLVVGAIAGIVWLTRGQKTTSPEQTASSIAAVPSPSAVAAASRQAPPAEATQPTQLAQKTVPLTTPSPTAPSTATGPASRVTPNRASELDGVQALPQDFQDAVKQAITSQEVTTPSGLSTLAETNDASAEGAKEVTSAALSPSGTMIRKARPTLRWRPSKGATNYVVKVYDADRNEVATSDLKGTSWTVPVILKRGGTYSWEVTPKSTDRAAGESPTTPTRTVPMGRFKVLEEPQTKELEHVLATNPRSSRLVRGILFARAGLLDEAEWEFKAAVRANPRSAVARKMLQSVRAKRHKP